MKFKFNPLSGNFETILDLQSAIGLLTHIPCDPSVFQGAVVRINSNGVLVNALADNLENSNVLGIVEKKLTDEICNVRLFGITKDLFSNLDVTKQYYLSSSVPGSITDIVPTEDNSIKVIVGIPLDDKKMLVFKSERQLIKINFIESGAIRFGDQIDGDLSIDTGDRTNDSSVVDQGLRIINGNI